MEARVHEVIAGGEAGGDIEKAVVVVRDESVHIKGEARLEGPDAQDDGTSKGELNNEKVRLEG